MFPEYESVEDPLLCFIYFNGGGTHQVGASDTYRPLADFFGLSTAERNQARPDGRDEPLWNNMVQWARRKLKDKGHLASSPRGTWRLSDEGGVCGTKNLLEISGIETVKSMPNHPLQRTRRKRRAAERKR